MKVSLGKVSFFPENLWDNKLQILQMYGIENTSQLTYKQV